MMALNANGPGKDRAARAKAAPESHDRGDYTAVPDTLRKLPRWVCWQQETRDGKQSKVPYQTTGGNASSTNPATWADYETTVAASRAFDGIGFVLTDNDDIVGIDLDGCIKDDGQPLDWAQAIVDRTPGCYWERSPSGKGLRGFCRGDIPGSIKHSVGDHVGIEVYAAKRYLTITGKVFRQGDVLPAQEALTHLWNDYGKAQPATAPETPPAATGARLSDDEAEAMLSGMRGERPDLGRLMDGDDSNYSEDASKADFALMMELLRRTNGNPIATMQLFEMTARADRDKCQERPDYRKRTLDKAFTQWYEERAFPPVDESSSIQTAENRHRLELVDLDGFSTDTLPAVEYIAEPWLPRGYATLLGGHGGAGKSLLAATVAAVVADGHQMEFAAMPLTPGRALFVSLEDPGNLVRDRLRRICSAYYLDPERVKRNLVVLDGADIDAALAKEYSERGAKGLRWTGILDDIAQAGGGECFDLIVIDNASDAFEANENDRALVRAFMRRLGQLARQHNAAVVLLAHIDKHAARHGAQGNSYSGSTAWHNSSCSRLAMSEVAAGVDIVHEKNKLGPKAATVLFSWDENKVLVSVSSEGGAATAAIDDKSNDAAMVAAVKKCIERGIDVPAAQSGSNTTFHVLERLPDFPVTLKGKPNRERFWASIHRLLDSRELVIETYRTDARNVKKRYTTGGGSRDFCVALLPPYPLR